jgi:hypothetical protein
MLLCAKYTNGIKLFMGRSCLSVSMPIFNLRNYATNLDHIRYRHVKNTAQAQGKISFVPSQCCVIRTVVKSAEI